MAENNPLQQAAHAERGGAKTGEQGAAAVSTQRSSGLEVRCPHCHRPMQLSDVDSVANLVCSACHGHFSLVTIDETLSRTWHEDKQLGDFLLVESVGVGAFGVVWKAHDTRLDRMVAIKVPRSAGLNAEETEKFVREARAAAQVQHPNIVRVFEVGRNGDQVYIVSDFVEGVTLGQWLSTKRLAASEAARLCVKLALALDEAHNAGVVHRDLKPGNILMDLAFEPHITDFGLAKRESGEITVTLDGKLLGTPAYMSPEQARGEGHQADRRSDVYSLGVILYEMLTGERPFRGDSRMLVYQVLSDDPVSLRKLNSRVPGDLEMICLKCMEKSPDSRYQTMRELADELQRFLNGEPVNVRPVGSCGRAWRWYRRHPIATVQAAGGFATVCAVLFATWGMAGILTYVVGLQPTNNVWVAVRDATCFVLLLCAPMLWAGLQTLNNRRIGLLLGTFLWTLSLVTALAGITGALFDVGVFGSSVERAPMFVLFIILSLIGLGLYLVAVASHFSHEQ